MKRKGKDENIKLKPLSAEQFDKVYNQNFDHLFLFAIFIPKCDELSKNIIAEVFMNLWKKWNKFSEIR
ncbi:RNA polymerase sigma factor [Marinoscillum furvescens]|uniref:Uncharacterized protein n=1 Tax=Marinoscillum furvescens DSM 4134 TaxID=1122208 RepID=A0A3D9L0G1_MARFU|nr:hypothetical protein [Marinoscillum furvescens]RED94674.1 hypothetical protein C7460_12069 [Marinoscillum furvescens DSM 4134]